MLILGTLPGPVSLEKRQYYAQSRNAFWPIMGALFGAGPELAYRERLRKFGSERRRLWDVCQSAYREGALDASIDPGSIVPNDLAGFLRTHTAIRVICFNGQTAARLYRRLVLPAPAGGIARYPLRDTAVHEPGLCGDAVRAEAGEVAGRVTCGRQDRREARLSDWDEDRERPLPVAVPHTELSDEALRGVVESFVLREAPTTVSRTCRTRKKSRR